MKNVWMLAVVGAMFVGCGGPIESTEATTEETQSSEQELGIRCGNRLCGPGTYCCNASCGTCTPLFGVCSKQVCEPKPIITNPPSQQCGNKVCGKGTFCCNASCGTCAPIGGACTQQICNNPI